MPASRRAMRKILEVLRLKFEARLSHERIAAATRISKGAATGERSRRALLGGCRRRWTRHNSKRCSFRMPRRSSSGMPPPTLRTCTRSSSARA